MYYNHVQYNHDASTINIEGVQVREDEPRPIDDEPIRKTIAKKEETCCDSRVFSIGLRGRCGKMADFPGRINENKF